MGMLSRSGVAALALGVCATWVGAGCGDDGGAAAAGGCTTDVECKGDRLCIGGECVDPKQADYAADGGAVTDGGTSRHDGSVTFPKFVDDPELEAACGRDCAARQAAGCTSNIGSLDQCMAQCLIIDEQDPYCLDERTAHYACLASGGYTCASGYPQPKSTCIAEAQAVSACSQKAPCRAFCERQCDPTATCLDDCQDEQASFEDAICGIYYTQLLSCWGRSTSCIDGTPATMECEPQLAEVADCVARRSHECDGFCWVAERLGCGETTCVADCKLLADEVSCGSYYRSALDCAFGSHVLQMSCEAGKPAIGSECASSLEQYMTCLP